jgi:hypothetical protein
MTQTTEGTGPGSVERVKSRIVNGDVKDSNLSLTTIINNAGGDLENVELIKAPDGNEEVMSGSNLVIKGGEAYTEAGEEDSADGGDVVISGGMQHGDGNSGDVLINGGDSSTDFFNSDGGDVVLRGGDGLGPGDSDGGDVNIRGGDAEVDGSIGDGGDVHIRGGNSVGEDGGDISISAGNSGSGEDEENNTGGKIDIFAGDGGGPSGRGGDVNITAGNGDGGYGSIFLNSLVALPVFETQVDRNNGHANHPSPRNGMICYVTELNAITVYVNGAWVTLNTSAIV